MDAVLDPLRRDPPFTLWLFGLWARVPALLWLIALFMEFWALEVVRGVH